MDDFRDWDTEELHIELDRMSDEKLELEERMMDILEELDRREYE